MFIGAMTTVGSSRSSRSKGRTREAAAVESALAMVPRFVSIRPERIRRFFPGGCIRRLLCLLWWVRHRERSDAWTFCGLARKRLDSQTVSVDTEAQAFDRTRAQAPGAIARTVGIGFHQHAIHLHVAGSHVKFCGQAV